MKENEMYPKDEDLKEIEFRLKELLLLIKTKRELNENNALLDSRKRV